MSILRWGILGTGWISGMFVRDLTVDRKDATDITHVVTVVGARDKLKAESFINEVVGAGTQRQASQGLVAKACGSYEEVMNSQDVDIIYIGTLNDTHFSLAKEALEAGKHVLVEKPACLTAADWDQLVGLAQSKGLFLMEGMWTSFLPVVRELRRLLHEEKVIGEIRGVSADFSQAQLDFIPPTHRLLSLEHGGGAMFDLGPYPVFFAMLALFDSPSNDHSMPKVNGWMLKNENGIDVDTSIALDFSNMGAAGVRANLSASINRISIRDDRAVIIGTKGQITVNDGLSRATKLTIKLHDEGPAPRIVKWKEDQLIERPLPGFGLMFEADAAARAIRDGRLECKEWSHRHTKAVLEIFDTVRGQAGYGLPP